jgi:transposase InsO family protein
MPKKRFSPEQIIATLRQIEVQLAQGKSIALACKEAPSQNRTQDECLKLEIFYSLKEAQVIIGAWKDHYNRVRPHSSLGYRPPAPVRWRPSHSGYPHSHQCSRL